MQSIFMYDFSVVFCTFMYDFKQYEKGSPSVAIGIYAAVLHALNNMDKDLLLVAKDDAMGRRMQDLNLLTRKRSQRREK